jgi:KTSC domain
MNGSLPTPISVPATVVLLDAVPLASSLLASVAYDHDRAILQLEFRSGAIYQYFGVPRQGYQELLQADSHGTHFNRHLRNCFRYALVHHPSPSAAIHFPSILGS